MSSSLFFSWQGDTSSSNGRNFLRKTLEEACKETALDTEIDEAVREEMIVDSDTQGVPGQAPIVDTILKKIDAATIVVADVTFTGSRSDGRPTPNPNVLIEYGWALKSLAHGRVITVMNENYGKASVNSLPFDLAHIRWPIRYTLSEKANEEEREKVRKQLVKELKEAIKVSLGTIVPKPAEPPSVFPMEKPKHGRARFRNPGEALGFHDSIMRESRPREVFLADGPAVWLRVMPSIDQGKKWTPLELKKQAQTPGTPLNTLFNSSGGYDYLRASDGWGMYKTPSESSQSETQVIVSSIAFAFETGEIWSIDTTWLSGIEIIPFIENYFNARLEEYANFLKILGISHPYKWVAGISGVRGRTLDIPLAPGHFRIGSGPLCVEDTIEAKGDYTSEQTASESLLPFYRKIFEKCGIERPVHLD